MTDTTDDRNASEVSGPVADGGNVALPLEALESSDEATTTVTRRDKLFAVYDIYLYTPASIMWHDLRARVGALIFIFYLLMGTVGSWLLDPTTNNDGPLLLPWFRSLEHPLGTDFIGQDVLTLVVHSTTPVLKMMLAGGLFTVGVGTVIGIVAGYKGGSLDKVLSTFTDIFINIPGLPLVVVLSAIFEPENPYLVGILLTIAAWAGLARGIRSQVLVLRNESFIEASRVINLPLSTIVRKDILSHLMPYVMMNFVSAMRGVVFSAVALYFLGVLPFSDSNWGIMLNRAYSEGAHYRPQLLYLLVIPMFAIVGISIGMILLAQSLDRVFNPRIRARHARTSSDDGETESETLPQEKF